MKERENEKRTQNSHLEATRLGIEFLKYLRQNNVLVSTPRIDRGQVIYQEVDDDFMRAAEGGVERMKRLEGAT